MTNSIYTLQSDVTQDTINAFKSSTDIQKSVGTSAGLYGVDIQEGAKLVVPVVTPVINELPRRMAGTGGSQVGVATTIRRITSYDTSFNQGGVPEGKRNADLQFQSDSKTFTYATLSVDNSVTFEAVSAGAGFDDVLAKTKLATIGQLKKIEERNVVFGNATTIALGTPVTPTIASAATAGTFPASALSCIVVALTAQGMTNARATNGHVYPATTANVVPQALTGGQPGDTFTYGGGSSIKSAAGTVTPGDAIHGVTVTTTAIQGAAGYAWFIGASGSEVLHGITSNNTATFANPVTGTQAAATNFTVDNSKNAYGYDGLLYQALASGSNSYVSNNGAAKLTTNGAGGITEIDTALATMYQNYQLSVDRIYVNIVDLQTIRNLIIKNNGAPLIRQNTEANPAGIVGSPYVIGVLHPVTGQQIDIKVHPDIPQGTVLGYSTRLPYQLADLANPIEVVVRREYYEIDYARVNPTFQFGIRLEATPACYFTPSMMVIYNIAPGA